MTVERQTLRDIDLGIGREAEPELPIVVETWADFERSATETIPTIIDGLWPEGAFGFVAGPPKKGKTWLGISLALSVASGLQAFGQFTVPTPRPVIYLALEGHRAAIRGRIGCLARGMGINPDRSGSLDNLHIIYKPRGLDIADSGWVATLRASIFDVKPALIVVDVLRAAASYKESSNDDFRDLRRTLQPISDDGIAIALLHHFGKLTELTKERSAGERMSGAGAMYGAMDVGAFITGSEEGARKLRVEFELRDLATPEPMGLRLAGEPTGVNGGFVYTDTASWAVEAPPDEADLEANPADFTAWLDKQPGRQATTAEIIYALGISDSTILRRRPGWTKAGVIWTPGKGGKPALYSLPESTSPSTSRQAHHHKGEDQETLDMQEERAESFPARHSAPPHADGHPKSAYLQGKELPVKHVSPTESANAVNGSAHTDDLPADWADDAAAFVDLEITPDPPPPDPDDDIPF